MNSLFQSVHLLAGISGFLVEGDVGERQFRARLSEVRQLVPLLLQSVDVINGRSLTQKYQDYTKN